MPRVEIDSLPPTSRTWLFGISPALNETQSRDLLRQVDAFLDEWAAHGAPPRLFAGRGPPPPHLQPDHGRSRGRRPGRRLAPQGGGGGDRGTAVGDGAGRGDWVVMNPDAPRRRGAGGSTPP